MYFCIPLARTRSVVYLTIHKGMTPFKFAASQARSIHQYKNLKINRLKPNDPYMGRTAPLTSKRCILYIYSTNVGTEYFKHALYSPFFSL